MCGNLFLIFQVELWVLNGLCYILIIDNKLEGILNERY